ncbi:MAG: MBL fold metallo-hydrolase [Planctomycetota bacterium]|nr:MBL fold metallo-hydrolase [Planctomycetota bacterium]
MTTPILKVLRNEGCCSYLVGCPVTRQALIIDPKVGQENLVRYYLDCYELHLSGILDTHTHADHLSASVRFAGPDIPIWMSRHSKVRRVFHGLEHGQDLCIGDLKFKALEVPGHTPDSIALYGHGMVFTGDSLFIDGLARTDFYGSDSAQLFDSVAQKLMGLPENTLVFPGHDYADLLFSTIGCEAAQNAALACKDGTEYSQSLRNIEGAGNSPAVAEMISLNLMRDPQLPSSPMNAAACCASPSVGGKRKPVLELPTTQAKEAHAKMASSKEWVDVRDPHEWRHGRIPNTLSIPLSELGFHLDKLQGQESLFLSCRTGVRSITAANTLQRLGVIKKPVSLTGGILGWQAQMLPIEGLPST